MDIRVVLTGEFNSLDTDFWTQDMDCLNLSMNQQMFLLVGRTYLST